MNNIIHSTIEQIKNGRIKPEPKWKYLAKKHLLWILFWLIIISAAVSLSVVYNNLKELDWDLYRFLSQNMAVYYLSLIPYFWVGLIALFLLAAFLEIRRTERGYRYSWLKIIIVVSGSLAVMAGFASLAGIGGAFNSTLKKNFPYYRQHMVVTKETQWMQPEKGFLAGTITSVSENKLKILDLGGNDWDIETSDETFVRPAIKITPEEAIKIIGKKESDNIFRADEIRPWNGMGKGMGGGGQRGRMHSK